LGGDTLIADILLTIAAFGFTFSVIPQLRLLHRKKKSDEISLSRNVSIFICIAMTIVANYILNTPFALVMNTIQLVLCGFLIAQVLYYRKNFMKAAFLSDVWENAYDEIWDDE
jgi:uncharacterized protein with PQ loop repeat